MKLFSYLFCLFFLSFTFSSFSMEEEIVFELKREIKKPTKQIKSKKTLPLKFKRKSFSFHKDFLIFNEKSVSHIKKGTVLQVHIFYETIASFEEENPIFGFIFKPFKAVVFGKIKAIKNTNKALILFNELIMDKEIKSIKTSPVFITGDLKESFLKDFFNKFFDILSTATNSYLGIFGNDSYKFHLLNTALQNQNKTFSEREKDKRIKYLEFKKIKPFKIIIK